MSDYTPLGSSTTDPTMQQHLAQYLGQMALAPNQQITANSDPAAAAAGKGFASAFHVSNAPPLPAQGVPPGIAQLAMQQGAQTNPNVNGMNMGGVGPTQQNYQNALAQGLMNSPQTSSLQQFMNP